MSSRAGQIDWRAVTAGRVSPEPSEGIAPSLDPDLERDLRILRLGGTGDPTSPGAPRPRRRRFPWGKLITLVVVVAGIAGGVSYWRLTRPVDVTLVSVAPRDLGLPPTLLTASGYIVAKRQITVSSKTQGKIVEMPVGIATELKHGELIARVQDDEQRAQVKVAEAQLAQAELDVGRARELTRAHISSQSDLDKAETDLRVASAQLELAKVALADTLVTAPIDGTVIRKIRDVGEFLTLGVTAEGDPGSSVVTLADMSAIDVELEINETEITKIHMGGAAIVTPEAMPEQRYVADVFEIGAMADRKKSVVPVKARLREPSRELRPDMTAKVTFVTAAPSAPIQVKPGLPASAVVERGGRKVVLEVENDRAVEKPIRVEPGDNGFVTVLDGAPDGTFVIDQPPASLAAGQRVHVKS